MFTIFPSDLSFLNGCIVKNCARFEDPEVCLPVVSDGCFDGRVACHFKLHIKRRCRLRRGRGEGQKRHETSCELHISFVVVVRDGGNLSDS